MRECCSGCTELREGVEQLAVLVRHLYRDDPDVMVALGILIEDLRSA